MASRDRSVKASSSFATLLDRRALRHMAGSRSFERGEDYFGSIYPRAYARGYILRMPENKSPLFVWGPNENSQYFW